ncbi:MAG: hypothetical protein ABL882_10725 [Sphingopyxis sp.]
MIFSYFKRRREKAEAFAMGRQAGNQIASEVEELVQNFCVPRREKFLMVLDQRLTGIQHIEGATFEQQARIEWQVMVDNWKDYIPDQQREIWQLLEAKGYGAALHSLEDPTKQLIGQLLDAQFTQLFTDGLNNVIEAVERQKINPIGDS